MVAARIPMEVGGRRENLQEAPEPASWTTQCRAGAETKNKVEGGNGPYKSVENKDTGLLENYYTLRRWLSQ